MKHAPVISRSSGISSRLDQAGKAGLALLMWLLGVPGGIVLLYLIFAH